VPSNATVVALQARIDELEARLASPVKAARKSPIRKGAPSAATAARTASKKPVRRSAGG
jgi:BMFP domain-containing protein YqiC